MSLLGVTGLMLDAKATNQPVVVGDLACVMEGHSREGVFKRGILPRDRYPRDPRDMCYCSTEYPMYLA